jgi:alpha-1,3-mannosyltransferase
MKKIDALNRLPTLSIMGVDITSARRSAAVELLDHLFSDKAHTAIAFANMNLLNIARNDASLRKDLTSFVIFNDGIGLEIASLFLHGTSFPENLNGTDFIPAFLEMSVHELHVFIFGGQPGVADRSLLNLEQRYPRHRFVGAHAGYFHADEEESIIQQIRNTKANFLLVGLGNPMQEHWLAKNLQATGCRLGFGVGAFIDFSSGNTVRAPLAMRRIRLEWLFRLALEPRRLYRRYITESVLFLVAVIRKRLAGPQIPRD